MNERQILMSPCEQEAQILTSRRIYGAHEDQCLLLIDICVFDSLGLLCYTYVLLCLVRYLSFG